MQQTETSHSESGKKRRVTRSNEYVDLSGYIPELGLSLTNLAAHFLDWMAVHKPKQYTPYSAMLKAMRGYHRAPVLGSKEVKNLQGNMSRVRVILREKYGRELDAQAGIGVRATVDDADTLRTSVPKKVSRFKAAKNALAATVSLVDPSKLPDTAEMAPWKRWLNRSVKDVLRMVNSDDFDQKLLNPSDSDDENK